MVIGVYIYHDMPSENGGLGSQGDCWYKSWSPKAGTRSSAVGVQEKMHVPAQDE